MGGLRLEYQNRRYLFLIEKCTQSWKLKRTVIKQSEVKLQRRLSKGSQASPQFLDISAVRHMLSAVKPGVPFAWRQHDQSSQIAQYMGLRGLFLNTDIIIIRGKTGIQLKYTAPTQTLRAKIKTLCLMHAR